MRDWFSDAGILICRPAPGNECRLGVALKGGHNAEHHNHNDVGSYVVVLGASTPLLDPGSEVYTARTFSSKRYDSNVLNSFGHPVPRVAGRLQRVGREAAAAVVSTSFTNSADTLELGLESAYDVPELKRLRRTFNYSREGQGKLSVVDDVEFSSPQSFGTAIITFSPWKQLDPNRLLVGGPPDAVVVEISTDGAAFQVHSEEIHEDLHGDGVPVRLGIDLTEPVSQCASRW